MNKSKLKIINLKDRTICKICFNKFEHLGSHIAKAHKLTAKQYKEKFGLPYILSLISPEVEEKKRIKFNEEREKYLKNLNTNNSKKHRFKKGIGLKNKYISKQQQINSLKNLDKINNKEKELCPVCNMIFLNLDSHLFMKHKLLRVKNEN